MTKSTKRALLMSTLALVLCVSMLIGTTFAWFTDSVVSGSNVIKSGNLDLEVEYTLDGETWNDLNGANDLFQKGLWEPGHTEVVVLKVQNKGSLALKYVANMNIVNEVVGINKNDEPIVLSDILTVSTLTQQVNDIGEIALMLAYMGEDKVAYQTTTFFKDANVLEEEKEMRPGDEYYLFIKVDMAETVGNEANYKGPGYEPSIEFGINFLATQYTYENDSFSNDYDANAKFDEIWGVLADTSWYNDVDTTFELQNVNQLAGLAKIVNSGEDTFAGKTVLLANNVNLGNQQWFPIGTKATPFSGDFDGNGKTVSNLNVVGDNGYSGLFGYVTAGTSISNLTVHNVTITDEGNDTSKIGLGSVVGVAKGSITLDNVSVTGLIQIGSVNGAMENGALIGYSQGATITNCSVIGADGSFVEASRWVGAIVGYDNKTIQMSGCRVENITLKATAYCGALNSVIEQNSNVNSNVVKNVNIVLEGAAGVEAATYGAFLGSSKTYSYSSKPYSFTAYDNIAESVTYTVNGATATAQDFGAKVSDGTDPDLAMAATIKVGTSYYSYLKFATSLAPKDGSEYVIELTGDTMIRAKFKPTVASGQNIVIKTNGYKLLNVAQDSSKNVVYNDDGTLKTTVVTNENVSSFISIKSGGTLIIE